MAGSLDDGEGGSISGINVTPLVDVMLVLLVIFMVTAPMIQQGVEVNLPQGAASSLPAEAIEKALIVSISANGDIYVGDELHDTASLAPRVAEMIADTPDRVVYVRGDRDASYGDVASAMAALKRGGVRRLGLMTESSEPPAS